MTTLLRRHLGGLAIALAAVALVVGPMAALAANDASADRVETLDQTGTDRALDEMRDLRSELRGAARERGELRGRLDAMETRLGALSARLNDAEAEAATVAHEDEVARQEAAELAEDAHDPTGIEAQAASSDDRWDALAACESTGDSDGVAPHNIDNDPDGYHLTAFQFSPDTAAKVGAYRGMPYGESKAAAQRWAAEPSIDASSTAGWPTCWPLVMGDTPT